MSNKTQASALSVRGQNPQNLIEAVIRNKIYQNRYWKEKLPGLTAASIIDEALELDYVSGTYGGNRKPSKFIMLALKLLQISPEKAEVMEYINQEDYKYLSALGCFYIRLVGSSEDVYNCLEPLYADYRKLRFRNIDGSFCIVHMDEFISSLINEEVYLDTLLPHITKRYILEENNTLKPRAVPQLLQKEIEKEEAEFKKQLEMEEEQRKQSEQQNKNDSDGERQNREYSADREKKKKKHKRKHSRSSSRSRSGSRDRKHKSHKHRSWRNVIKGKHKSSRRSKSRSRSKSSSREVKRQKEPAKDSIEYWNLERAKLGIPLL